MSQLVTSLLSSTNHNHNPTTLPMATTTQHPMPNDNPQTPHHHDQPKNEDDHPQMKTAAHKWQWMPTKTNDLLAHEQWPGPTNGHGWWLPQVSKLTPPHWSACWYEIQVPCRGLQHGNQTEPRMQCKHATRTMRTWQQHGMMTTWQQGVMMMQGDEATTTHDNDVTRTQGWGNHNMWWPGDDNDTCQLGDANAVQQQMRTHPHQQRRRPGTTKSPLPTSLSIHLHPLSLYPPPL